MLVNRDGKSYKATGAEIKRFTRPERSHFLSPVILVARAKMRGLVMSSYYPKTSADYKRFRVAGVVTLTVAE